MAGYNVTISLDDHTSEVIAEKDEAIARALEMIGEKAEGYAVLKCPVGTPESTGVEGYHGGTLRNSISHAVDGDSAIIGTNVNYGVFVEFGTGIYADNGNGRPTPWYWQDENGKWHRTVGMKPRHYLKSAATEHTDEYKAMVEGCLKDKM